MNEINGSDTAWILVATALVLVMTPGLALFYGGMVRAKLELTIDIRRGRTTASADRVQHEPLVVHVRDVERLARHTVADGEDAGREELQLGFRGVRRILEEPQAVTFTLNQYMTVVTGAMPDKSPHFMAVFSEKLNMKAGRREDFPEILLPAFPPSCEFSKNLRGCLRGDARRGRKDSRQHQNADGAQQSRGACLASSRGIVLANVLLHEIKQNGGCLRGWVRSPIELGRRAGS